MRKDEYVKRFRSGKSVWSDLNQKESYKLELECLRRLTELKSPHFPILKSFDDRRHVIVMSHQGQSLPHIKDYKEIVDYEEQIDRIIEGLREKRIIHLDILSKNICIKDSVISLIDFNIASLDGEFLNKKLKGRLSWFGGETDPYKGMRNLLINIFRKKVIKIS